MVKKYTLLIHHKETFIRIQSVKIHIIIISELVDVDNVRILGVDRILVRTPWLAILFPRIGIKEI